MAYHARFSAYGVRREMLLGHEPQWNPLRAMAAVDELVKQVAAGTWHPDAPAATSAPDLDATDPQVRELMSDWLALGVAGRKPATQADLTWRVSKHLLPYFYAEVQGYTADGQIKYGRPYRWSDITSARVDAYVAHKHQEREAILAMRQRVAEGLDPETLRGEELWRWRWYGATSKGLGITSINSTLATLRSITAYGRRTYPGIHAWDPAERASAGRSTPLRQWLQPDQVAAMVDAAVFMDKHERQDRTMGRESAVCALLFAGLRNQELGGLRMRDVDFQEGILRVHDAKTAAGRREVDMAPRLREALVPWIEIRKSQGARANDWVWPRGVSGDRRDRSSVQRRLFDPVVLRADKLLEARGQVPMPDQFRPHDARRTFCSMLARLEDITYVQRQMGHSSAEMTLEVYAQSSGRRHQEDPRLRAWFIPSDEQ